MSRPALAEQEPQLEDIGSETSYTAIGGGDPGHAGSIGVGVLVGEPLAVGARYWMTEQLAVQAWLGATVINSGVYLGADAIFGFSDVFRASNGKVRFDLWLGGGVAAGSAGGESGWHCHDEPWPFCHRYDDPARLLLAARVPAGISMMLRDLPLEVFVEVAMGLRLTPDFGPYASGGLGARWYF